MQSSMSPLLLLCLALMTMCLTACGVDVTGNENGFAVLELWAGEAASFSIFGEPGPCATYEVDGDRITFGALRKTRLWNEHP